MASVKTDALAPVNAVGEEPHMYKLYMYEDEPQPLPASGVLRQYVVDVTHAAWPVSRWAKADFHRCESTGPLGYHWVRLVAKASRLGLTAADTTHLTTHALAMLAAKMDVYASRPIRSNDFCGLAVIRKSQLNHDNPLVQDSTSARGEDYAWSLRIESCQPHPDDVE